MGSTLRDKILGSGPKLKSRELFVPEWEVTIVCKELTGAERAKIEQETISDKGKIDFEKMYPMIVISGVYDQEGNKVFNPTDRDTLMAGSGAAITRVAKVIMELSGWGEKEAEELEKN